MAKGKKEVTEQGKVLIRPPNMNTAKFVICGTSPYVQNKFSEKALEQIKRTQLAGQTDKKGKAREPKDFKANYEAAKHISVEGWEGIPAPAFRAAIISACRMVNFAMTRAKLSIFIKADGFDKDDGTPLVRITKGKSHYSEHAVRLEKGGCDIRSRPMWDIGWEAVLAVQYDADQFTLNDVANLLVRVGVQVGIGEGRADSKKSCGMGWGFFEVSGGQKG